MHKAVRYHLKPSARSLVGEKGWEWEVKAIGYSPQPTVLHKAVKCGFLPTAKFHPMLTILLLSPTTSYKAVTFLMPANCKLKSHDSLTSTTRYYITLHGVCRFLTFL